MPISGRAEALDAGDGDGGVLAIRELSRLGIAASFELRKGECVVLQGPSGAGKTVLLRAIADLDPSTGTATLDGDDRVAMSGPAWRKCVTYVAAEAGWWAETVGEHYDDWSSALPLIARLGLPTECRAWPVARLSSGERQRLGLVRALVIQPRVLLLDEPTAALDPTATSIVERIIAERVSDGAAALWVTHDCEQARRVAARRLVIAQGRVIEATL